MSDWETSQLTFNPNWCVSSAVSRDSYVTRRQPPSASIRSRVQAFSQDTDFNQLTAEQRLPPDFVRC